MIKTMVRTRCLRSFR